MRLRSRLRWLLRPGCQNRPTISITIESLNSAVLYVCLSTAVNILNLIDLFEEVRDVGLVHP